MDEAFFLQRTPGMLLHGKRHKLPEPTKPLYPLNWAEELDAAPERLSLAIQHQPFAS